jgi:hypothetical protein
MLVIKCPMLLRSKRLKKVKLRRLRKLEYHIGSVSLVDMFMKVTIHLTSARSVLLQKVLLCRVSTTKKSEIKREGKLRGGWHNNKGFIAGETKLAEPL